MVWFRKGYRSVRSSPNLTKKKGSIFMSQPKKRRRGSWCSKKFISGPSDGCCGGSGSLNNAGGGLKLKRHWVESPDKQAKSGRIQSVTLFTKPPTAPLELLSAQLQRIFTGKVCSSLFLPVLSMTNVEKAPYLLHKPTMFPYVSCVNNCGCSWQLDLWLTQLCWDRSRCSLCAEQLI